MFEWLGKVVGLLTEVYEDFTGYFDWLPDEIGGLLILGVGSAVLFQFLGR